MEEPHYSPRPCSTPHSAPVGWLRTDQSTNGASSLVGEVGGGPAASAAEKNPLLASSAVANAAPPPNPPHEGEGLSSGNRAAIELVLADPEAVAEVIGRAPPAAFASHACAERSRSDGWTPERMATFLEALADTGLITEACRAAGMARSGAYELRNRDLVFASAVRAAQASARPQVSDGLLERSITGTVEHYYRDGVLVGERRHYESWLGLAVLKRLDRQAEEDRTAGNLAWQMTGDWQRTLDALRSGGTAAVPALFTPELDKVDTPPSPPDYDPSEDCWKTDDGLWMTVFPPPPGFDGHQNREWDGFNRYERACTAEEADLLEARQAHLEAEEQDEVTAGAEAERDAWFDRLRAERDSRSPAIHRNG